MPKVNTLFNYFTSPKTAKQPNGDAAAKPKPKPETPKRSQEQRNKAVNKGKENRNTEERKRSYKDDEEEEEDEVKPVITKKRRLIIPDVDSGEDSGDDFKPDPAELDESEDSVSDGVPESDPDTPSEEETPKKKAKPSDQAKVTGKRGKRSTKTQEKNDSKPQAQSQPTASVPNPIKSWPHLKFDFLQPDKIRDINRRPKSDPNYDPSTLYIPPEFLSTQTPAVRQWWEFKTKHFDCVLFFKVGKFYELYHMDAVIGVNELNLTFMRGEFAHSGFPEIGYGRFSASLIERGFKVARVEQTETPDMMTKRCSKMTKPTKFDKVVRREICQISTRGTRVYTPLDVKAPTSDSNYLLSLVEKYTPGSSTPEYGVCFLDTTIGDFHLGQFSDDRCNSRLFTLLAHYPPVHVVYERGNLSQKTMQILNSTLTACRKDGLLRETQFWSPTTTLKSLHEGEYFDQPSESSFVWPKGLQPYLNERDSLGLSPAEDKELAIHALGGIVYLLKDYLLEQQLLAQGRFKTYNPPDISHNRSETTFEFPNSMVLDAVTINNLKLIGEGSLLKTLDRCCTAFGKRLLREWVCRPSCIRHAILERQEAVQELMEHAEVVQTARGIMGDLPDLERLLSKIHGDGNLKKMRNHPDGRAIMFEGPTYSKRVIVDFISTIDAFGEILKLVTLFQEFKSKLIQRCARAEPVGEFPSLEETLHYFKTGFDHEQAKKEGCIVPKKGMDAEYDSVLIELAEIKKDADEYLKRLRQQFGVKVTYIGSDKKRFQIEIPESKDVGSGFELQSQRKGFRRYYTPQSREILGRQINAEEHRDKVLKDLSRRMFEKFSDKYDLWATAVYKISVLDVLMSLAQYALTGDMCVPEISNDSKNRKGFIEIRDGKHPCFQSEDFIPNDTFLATGNTASCVILTGPNMGGKSTLMRQTGLIVVLAQMGSLVPASSCSMTLVDRIFTRLGANDDILAGQSTFFVELSETATILHHATQYSLVLLDELGRGTSTYDGTAIAASVVDALTKLKCCTLFSTHYHSLVEEYKNNEDVTLAHMACMVETEEEDNLSQETVTFLYKLSEGACPKSYGFNAARLAGVPAIIIKKAHELATRVEKEAKNRRLYRALCNAKDQNIKDLIAAIKEI